MRRALSLLVGAMVTLAATEASAAFHVTQIVQVYAGGADSYVQIQAYSASQNFLSGHNILVYDAAGTQIASIALSNVANGADQANVLIGTAGVNAAFGVAPDFTLTSNLAQAGGKVCFDAIDCFTWGAYTGGDNGTPFAALTAAKAAKRTITGGTNATGLDLGDDTNDSAADFTAVTPAPKNNSGASGGMDAGTDAGTDASVPPGMDASTPPQDSGVGTTPTPPKEGGAGGSDSGAGGGGGGSGGGGGCSLGAPGSSEGWSTSLGLLTAASILVLSRRRREKR